MTPAQAGKAAARCREAAADFRAFRDEYRAAGVQEIAAIYMKLAVVMEEGARKLQAIERAGEE